jgi:hypothetical protein
MGTIKTIGLDPHQFVFLIQRQDVLPLAEYAMVALGYFQPAQALSFIIGIHPDLISLIACTFGMMKIEGA